MKKTLLSTTLLSLLLVSCNSTESEHDSNENIKENIDTSTVEVEVPTKPWKDSLAKFDVFAYAQMLDSNLLRNDNTEKMFLAKPKYTRCQDKGWKSAFLVELDKNLISYQTTNSDEEYKVMGWGYEPEYHSRKSEDTITLVKVYKVDENSNLILTASNTEVGGYDNYLIDLKLLRHDSTGLNDVTDELLPKVKYTDYLSVPLDSTDLKVPEYLPLIYRMNYYDKDVLMIQFNGNFVDIDKKYSKEYNWIDDFQIKDDWSIDPHAWMPSLHYKVENGKFVKTEEPKSD